MFPATLLVVTVIASLQGTDGVPFLGATFNGPSLEARQSGRLSRQDGPGQFAQLPPSLDGQGFDGDDGSPEFGNQGFSNQGFDNQGFDNQGFGNQGFGNQRPENQGFGNQRPGNLIIGNQRPGNQISGNQGPSGNQGFGNQGRPGNQGFGNQGGDDDDDMFVFDRPTGRPRPTQSRPTTQRTQRPTRVTQTTTTQASSGATTPSACVTSCPTTGEFNPVCGTDRVTYSNPGRLNCAANCGRSVGLSHYGTCITTTTTSTTVRTNQQNNSRQRN